MTLRYTVTLRAAHPFEAQVIAELEGIAPRRRQIRVRELLRQGLNVPTPAAYPTHTTTRPALRMRQEIHLSEAYDEDEAVREQIKTVHPELLAEFLRDRIVAGLLGTVDFDLTATPAMTASVSLASPPKGSTSAPSATTSKATETQLRVVHAASPAEVPASTPKKESDPEVIDSEEPKLRSELRGLLE